jgi:hypothetical protein
MWSNVANQVRTKVVIIELAAVACIHAGLASELLLVNALCCTSVKRQRWLLAWLEVDTLLPFLVLKHSRACCVSPLRDRANKGTGGIGSWFDVYRGRWNCTDGEHAVRCAIRQIDKTP